MKLFEFFQNIALGDLYGTNFVETGTYEILPKHLPRVIQSLNQGLDYLYTIFALKQSEVVIELKQGISRYYLDSLYARSNKESGLKYIMDTEYNPFLDDVIQIQSIFNEEGLELLINDSVSYSGVHTPEYNCIQISDGTLENAKFLTVLYKAKHPRIPLNEPLSSKLTLQIPASFEGALQAYVASNLMTNTVGEDSKNTGNIFYAKFRTMVDELKMQGIGTLPQVGTNIKPLIGGWK